VLASGQLAALVLVALGLVAAVAATGAETPDGGVCLGANCECGESAPCRPQPEITSEDGRIASERAQTYDPSKAQAETRACPDSKKQSSDAPLKPSTPVESAEATGVNAVPSPNAAASRSSAKAREIQKAIQVFQRETGNRGFRAKGRKSSRARASTLSLLHGRIYQYIRNNSFDAVPHEVVQRGGQANLLRRSQIGFSINGPVRIPKLYDGRGSTFFTLSYEDTREKVGRSQLTTIPTALQRSGDFSDLLDIAGDPMTVYDPASTRANTQYDAAQPVSGANLEYVREPFPNNQIPASRLDPVAVAALPHYPLPNTSVGPFFQNNYWVNPIEENSPNGVLAKLDHNLFERHKVTVDLAHSSGFRGEPNVYPTIANPTRPDRRFSDRRIAAGETFAISPRAIYNASAEASSQAVATDGLDSTRVIPKELGLQGVSGVVFPTIVLNGFSGLGPSSGSYYRNVWNTYATGHSLSLQKDNHPWTVSTSLRFHQLNTLELESPSGSFDFNQEQTGLPGITNTGSSYSSRIAACQDVCRK